MPLYLLSEDSNFNLDSTPILSFEEREREEGGRERERGREGERERGVGECGERGWEEEGEGGE